MNSNNKKGLRWKEIIALVGLLALLVTVLIPPSRNLNGKAKRTRDASNTRHIFQAALIYAHDNDKQLPGLNLTPTGERDPESITPNLHAIAAALARGGLNDGSIWMSEEDQHPSVAGTEPFPILTSGTPRELFQEFQKSGFSFNSLPA